MSVGKGTRFRSAVADENVLWEVDQPVGRGSWRATAVNEPYEFDGRTYDSDHAGRTDVFDERRIAESAALLASAELRAGSDDWWSSQEVGETLHYHDGGSAFVRGSVVVEDGETRLQPTALLGEWHRHDLPRRSPDGSLQLGHRAANIVNGEGAWRPDAWNVYEHPSFARRHPRAGLDDPRDMEPLDLTGGPEPDRTIVSVALRFDLDVLDDGYDWDADPDGRAEEYVQRLSDVHPRTGQLNAVTAVEWEFNPETDTGPGL